ncbi:polyketide synthase [Moorena producens PAL-8-15-08-1]|uniref:Polyketide synthase n=1 Tax=Moorena producens PAL-8-15-08-1 TaxID=1458985 RepID=A0A1D8TZX9_9CYAN|nr:type I polyketide synthase [Moorena producens]AOX03124.1 polyketide synthase [Moorena producens PAL-8-15-08-1]
MNKTVYLNHDSDLTENRHQEPIAIIGMGCRFPGKADSPEAFWQLLSNGVNAVKDIPSSRWDLERYYDPNPTPGKFYVRSAAFLEPEEIEEFDAEFFRMASREAASLDPQQRLLLEVSWEALEHAGIAPTSLAGSQTGVFVGIHWDDYSAERFYMVNPSDLNAYPTLSNLRSLSAGRIAYVLDLHGPTLQVDTACSSGLVSVHLACQSLQNRESNLAIAGGVSLLLSPKLTVGFCQMNVLAKDGRCKTFSDSVDGFVQGEGCGMIILKRLRDALRDRDPILATIRSSAINHDGYSLTLTTPAIAAQESMLRQAVENAQIEPQQVQYVETHGTGTPLGDPIEVKALAKVLGQNRQNPLVIGSMKTNMGHLGAASGVAGLIKTVLSLQHNHIPPNLHFDKPNRRIPWHKLAVTVPTELMPWAEDEPKLAGVSCFGMSGTNAHVILEAPPKPSQVELSTEVIEPQYHLLTLSAKSEKALNAITQNYLTFLDTTEYSLGDICYSAATGRSHFSHRLAIIANSKAEIRQQLDSLVKGEKITGLIQGDTYGSVPKIAFLFTGQGSQYVDMGRELYETQPTFRRVLQQCDEILHSYLDRPLLSILYPNKPEDIINLTAYTQPAIFAFEYALAELWKSWGIIPDVVMGHSVGEYVAACVAGVFSLEDGLKLIATRGKLIGKLPQEAHGKMVSVMASEELINSAIAPYGKKVSIAAVNGPQSIVISGDSPSIDAIVTELQAKEIKTRELTVSHAFHSPLMESVLKPFGQVAAEVTYCSPQIPLISNLTGEQVTDDLTTANHWVNHIRQPVRFADGMNTLQKMGIKCFVEIGAKPILLGMGANCLVDQTEHSTWLPSIRTDAEYSTLVESLAQLYVRGIKINWQGFFSSEHHRKVVLPTYPFQRERCWVEVQQERVARKSSKISAHPLLQERIYSSVLKPGEVQFEAYLAHNDLAYLLDHRAFGQAIMPASAYLEMVLAAGNQLLGTPSITFKEVAIEKALKLEEIQTVQLVLNSDGEGYSWQIFGLVFIDEEPTWTRYAAGKISRGKEQQTSELNTDLTTLKTRLPQHQDIKAFYQQVATQEFVYESNFQNLRRLWCSEGEALGQINLAKHLLNHPYHWHPVLLDGCFQVILAALPTDSSDTYLPVAYPDFTFWEDPDREVFSYVKLHGQPGQETLKADLQLVGKEGKVYAEAIGLQLKKARSQSLQQKELWKDWLCQLAWKEVKKPVGTLKSVKQGDWLILADRTGLGKNLADLLSIHEQRSHLVYTDKTDHKLKPGQDSLNWKNPADWQQLLGKGSYQEVVYLWGLDEKDSCDSSCEQVLHLVQALISANISPRLWLVTQGAQSVFKDDIVNIWQTPMWGLGKTLSLEHPEFATTCLDLSADRLDNETAKSLLQELLTPDHENQIAYRRGVRYGARLDYSQPVQTLANTPVTLKLNSYGTLDNLALVPLASSSLAPDEVEIKVRASGLNFRDVLRALGMMRDIEESLGIANSARDILFGFECAGTIERVGKQVSDFQVGDAVIAYASGSLASLVKAKATLVVSKPPELSFEEAATVPVNFLTAYYGLLKCAQIGSTDRILIHNAAGGVGQAAVQLAKLKGAEVFATASPPKWDFLKSVGIKHIYNSRTLEFAEQIMADTDGKGVNVVLNSLAGQFIDKSFDVLAQGGRFVEIGKLGIWDEQKLQALRPDAAFFPFDLGEMDGAKISAMLLELMNLFKEGKLKPLPLKAFPITEYVNAFRYMQQAKHIGKVVLSFQNPENCLVRQDSSYLIAGGLGALGLQVAQWLVEQGAKHIVLTGRSSVKPAAKEAIKQLEHSGAKVSVVQADISHQEDVKKILTQCPNLAGIIHTAGVLADGLLREQTPTRFHTVMASKVQGAWNLHLLTQDLPLDFFVCYSSAASLLGNAGQSNYAAANAFLDGLANYRRAQGLPSLSINWGPWGEVGMAAKLSSRLKAQGWGIISPQQGLPALDYLVKHGDSSQVGVLPMNWSTFLERMPENWPLWENFQTNIVKSSQEQPALLDQLKATLAHERRTILMEHVRSAIRKIIGLNASTRIEPRQSLFNLGLDSLMAVELRNNLEKSTEHSLRSTLLFDYPTLEALVNYLLQEVLIIEDTSAQTADEETTTSSQVFEELSEEEADILLASKYEKLNRLLGNI